MTYFLDTCILVHASTPFDKNNYDKASQILESGKWLTSTIVAEEVLRICERREKIYLNIVEYVNSKAPEGNFSDLYSSSFKSVLGSNRNDERHVRALFEHCLSEACVKNEDVFTEATRDKFFDVFYPAMNEIRVLLGATKKRFGEAEFKKDHIAPRYYKLKPKKFSEIRNLFYSLPEGKKHKEDIKIYADAVFHSEETGEELIYATTDRIFLANKTTIEKGIKRMQPTSAIEIKHLRDL